MRITNIGNGFSKKKRGKKLFIFLKSGRMLFFNVNTAISAPQQLHVGVSP